MTPTLVFDIETVPDVAGIRVLHGLSSQLDDNDVAEIAFHQRRAQTGGSDFLQLHLQRVVAISCVLREGQHWRVWSIGKPEDSEGVLIQRFFDGIEKFTPQLVSWNGGGFDLQVLHYRGLMHHVTAPRYWDMGEGDYRDSKDFKWSNYISRYHQRHIDLMDLLARFTPRANAPLDDMAKLCGLPGKLGMDGSAVWGAFQQGKLGEIRAYCETDVVNTYLVFLRFQLMRGQLSPEEHQREVALVRSTLAESKEAHWNEYLAAWPANASGGTA
jgi:3'-5' exonuclease